MHRNNNVNLLKTGAVLFGVDLKQRKSLKRNSDGFENFQEYFLNDAGQNILDTSDEALDDKIQKILCRNDTNDQDVSTDNHGADASGLQASPMTSCSPKRLSFSQESSPPLTLSDNEQPRFVGLARLSAVGTIPPIVVDSVCSSTTIESNEDQGNPLDLSDAANKEEQEQEEEKEEGGTVDEHGSSEGSDTSEEIEEGNICNLSDTAVSLPVEKSTFIKCKRKRKKITAPKARNTKKHKLKNESGSFETEKGVVNIGGKKYARLIVGERPGATPGVRRGRRKRIETLQPGQLVQYKYHWGVTPDRRLGSEVEYVLKPIADEKPKMTVTKSQKQDENQFISITDPVSGDTVEQKIVQSLSSITPTNLRGENLSPEDDVSYQRFIGGGPVKCGNITFKRHSEKSTARTGDNFFVFFVLKGTVDFTVNDQSFNASSKSWVSIPPNTVYNIINNNRYSAELIYMVYKGAL